MYVSLLQTGYSSEPLCGSSCGCVCANGVLVVCLSRFFVCEVSACGNVCVPFLVFWRRERRRARVRFVEGLAEERECDFVACEYTNTQTQYRSSPQLVAPHKNCTFHYTHARSSRSLKNAQKGCHECSNPLAGVWIRLRLVRRPMLPSGGSRPERDTAIRLPSALSRRHQHHNCRCFLYFLLHRSWSC